MTLYEMTSEMLELLAMIEAGEIPEEAIADTLEAVEADWSERADAVISAIKNLSAEAEAISAEVQRLEKRAAAKEKAVARLKEYLSTSMQALKLPKFENAKHLVSFRRSTRTVISDEAALIEWARSNAPEVIMTGPERIRISEISKLMADREIPFISRVNSANIQIK